MQAYLDLLRDVLQNGTRKADRTGTGTRSLFGRQMRFDLASGFPLVTTKKVHMKSIVHELLWFLRGDTNVRYLQENGVTIWNEWADERGELGPVYGHQWRSWGAPCLSNDSASSGYTSSDSMSSDLSGSEPGVDQIRDLVERIQRDPDSRRLIVSAWNVSDVPRMALPPCHLLFQFYVAQGRLSCQLYQRSADLFLGVPFNIASYALLTMMVAQVTGLELGEFVHTFGDVHLYENHLEQTQTQLSREPRPLPTMKINPEVRDIFQFQYNDFTLENYDPHPRISAPVAV